MISWHGVNLVYGNSFVKVAKHSKHRQIDRNQRTSTLNIQKRFDDALH